MKCIYLILEPLLMWAKWHCIIETCIFYESAFDLHGEKCYTNQHKWNIPLKWEELKHFQERPNHRCSCCFRSVPQKWRLFWVGCPARSSRSWRVSGLVWRNAGSSVGLRALRRRRNTFGLPARNTTADGPERLQPITCQLSVSIRPAPWDLNVEKHLET